MQTGFSPASNSYYQPRFGQNGPDQKRSLRELLLGKPVMTPDKLDRKCRKATPEEGIALAKEHLTDTSPETRLWCLRKLMASNESDFEKLRAVAKVLTDPDQTIMNLAIDAATRLRHSNRISYEGQRLLDAVLEARPYSQAYKTSGVVDEQIVWRHRSDPKQAQVIDSMPIYGEVTRYKTVVPRALFTAQDNLNRWLDRYS